jgi:hypothetical protein
VTVSEAATLVVDLTRELSATRGERDTWRFLALASVEHASALARELQMIDERRYICRRRLEDERDVFLDQRDLRQQEAAA